MLIQFLVQKNSVGKNPKRTLMLVMGPSHLILGVLILIKKMMHNKRNSWRTFYYLLQKLTCLFALWKISGWSTWSCVKILRLCFQIRIKWINKPSNWGQKPWNNMDANFRFIWYNNMLLSTYGYFGQNTFVLLNNFINL
jgi:hypothetical protein